MAVTQKQAAVSSSPGVTSASLATSPTDEAAAKAVSETQEAVKAALATSERPKVDGNDPADGVVIEDGQKVTFDADRIGDNVVVKQNVYKKFYPPGTLRPSYTLLYSAGDVIPASLIEASTPDAAPSTTTSPTPVPAPVG